MCLYVGKKRRELFYYKTIYKQNTPCLSVCPIVNYVLRGGNDSFCKVRHCDNGCRGGGNPLLHDVRAAVHQIRNVVGSNGRLNALKGAFKTFSGGAVDHFLLNSGAIWGPGDETYGVTLAAIVLVPANVKYTEAALGFWQPLDKLLPFFVLFAFFAFPI